MGICLIYATISKERGQNAASFSWKNKEIVQFIAAKLIEYRGLNAYYNDVINAINAIVNNQHS